MKKLVLLAVWTAMSAPALGHAFLMHAVPGAGSTLASPPHELVLDFTEDLEPAFSGMDVTDGAGHEAAQAQTQISGHEMRLALGPLAPGSYRVSWHAVSVDTHRTEGRYTFTVKP